MKPIRPSLRSGIAAIFQMKSGKYRVRILFDGYLTPVDMFSTHNTELEAMCDLITNFVNVTDVTKQEFLCELDHIRLFGCRSGSNAYQYGDELPNEDAILVELEEIDKMFDTINDQISKLRASYEDHKND